MTTNYDDVRRKTGEGLRILRDTARNAALTLEGQVRAGKRRFYDRVRLVKDLDRLYAEIGRYIFDCTEAGTNPSVDDPFITDRIVAARVIKSRIAAVDDEIARISRKDPTP